VIRDWVTPLMFIEVKPRKVEGSPAIVMPSAARSGSTGSGMPLPSPTRSTWIESSTASPTCVVVRSSSTVTVTRSAA
jgi:hypothetical protein